MIEDNRVILKKTSFQIRYIFGSTVTLTNRITDIGVQKIKVVYRCALKPPPWDFMVRFDICLNALIIKLEIVTLLCYK